MIENKTVFVARSPDLSRWQLAQPIEARSALLGWRVSPEADRDSSVPDEVALLIARAIVTIGFATFPSSTISEVSTADVLRPLRPTTLREKTRLLLSGQLNQLRLVSTRAPEVAKTLFDEPAFPWWMQGQVVLIGNAPPVAISSLENALELVDPATNIDAH